MNLFKQYGIKEVADVVFYSITRVGDEEFYTPVLKLDTLKVSTLDKSAEKVQAKGGKGNKTLLTWNFGKEITLNLTDALFSPASMSMIWGGRLETKLSPYTSAIAKLNIANKYGALHYSTKAYPSPSLTDEEWEIVYKAAHEASDNTWLPSILDAEQKTSERFSYWTANYNGDDPYIERNRAYLRKYYFERSWVQRYTTNQAFYAVNGVTYDWYKQPFGLTSWNAVDKFTAIPMTPEINSYRSTPQKMSKSELDLYNEWFYSQAAMPEIVIAQIFSQIDELKKVATIETEIYDTEVVDRMEECIVKNPYGLTISTAEQKKNLMRYYRNDQSTSYVIYYDKNTMLPIFRLTDEGMIVGWNAENDGSKVYDRDMDKVTDSLQDTFTLKQGTQYYKWSRTVKRVVGEDDGILGKTFVIDADTFPDTYKIVGETYIREQKTQNDQRVQFVIHRAQVSSNTSVTLEAEGDPTTFDMQVDVLTPPNDIQMELKVFDVEEDFVHGGTRIVPQKSTYTYTQTDVEEKKTLDFTNDELY